MANSKYEHVRSFEQPDNLLPNTWIVVRIDGRGFTKFTTKHNFEKPNDKRALDLMNASAQQVMKQLPDLVLAYGDSDEFSFVFHKSCMLFERRASKLASTIVSTFTGNYVWLWPTYFPNSPLTQPLPSFDGRCVCYPSDENLRHYMSWRQVDCHINNLYNTTFWALVLKGNMSAREAEELLKGTQSADKNEILFSRFGINYNDELEIFRKGSVLYRNFFPTSAHSSPTPPQPAASSSPLNHPQLKEKLPRPLSQPLEHVTPVPHEDSPRSTASTPQGETFLSTSTTPSPAASPSLSIPSFPMPSPTSHFPQNSDLAPAPSNDNQGHTPPGSISKQGLHHLTPLPLPPPTLKPSTKPPPFLNPPNPTAHTNTSPQPSPAAEIPIPERTLSRSSKRSSSNPASLSRSGSKLPASTPVKSTTPRPLTSASASSTPTSKNRDTTPKLQRRSPSLSMLDTRQAPIIPLRISSIPLNNKPRKLSLHGQKSSLGTQSSFEFTKDKGKAKEVDTEPHAVSTAGRIDVPSPVDVEIRNKVMGGDLEIMQGEMVDRTLVIPPSARPPSSHSRIHSAPQPLVSYFPPIPDTKPESMTQHERSQQQQPQPQSPAQVITGVGTGERKRSKKSSKSKGKANVTEEGGWAAETQNTADKDDDANTAPRVMSRTQRDKDRKKRTKARIVIEHVDIIKDGFWDKRPWILSGRAK